LSESEESVKLEPSRMRHYADILNPLFVNEKCKVFETLFQFVCTLVRAAGMTDTGWDSYTESTEFLKDLANLRTLDFPNEKFPDPLNTHARLALISYCHITEMNFPYDLIANLLRLHLGLKYHTNPLGSLAEPIYRKVNGVKRIVDFRQPSPTKKMKKIQEMADEAKMSEVGKALHQIYNSTIRNAVYHSDYVVHNGSMRLLSDSWYSEEDGCMTPLIPFANLAMITNEAFAFHSALLSLYKRDRRSLRDFIGKFCPYDHVYKGLMEFLFEGDLVTGFRVYWPNELVSEYSRNSDSRCVANNLSFNHGGSIDFFVGTYANKPSAFSPLVEMGEEPVYAIANEQGGRPYWPAELKAYAL
jgi:hypothetical protein